MPEERKYVIDDQQSEDESDGEDMDDEIENQEQISLDQFKIKKEIAPYSKYTYINLVERNNSEYVLKKVEKSVRNRNGM